MTQLAFDFPELRTIPRPCKGGGDVHPLAPCGHCARCGQVLLSLVIQELTRLCRGHG